MVHDTRLDDLFIYHKLSQEQLHSYEQNGYLILGRTLTDKGLEQLREQVMQAWHAEKGKYREDATWLQNALFPDIHHISDVVRDYYFRGPLVDVAEQVIGPNIKTATSQLTFKMRGNTQTFGWHQDNGYGELEPYNAISSLTALDDVDIQNGCLWLIPGGHKQGQIPLPARQVSAKAKRERVEVVIPIDEKDAIPMQLRAGECLFFHAWLPHKSQGNHSPDRDRRILFMRYADADAVEVVNGRQPRLGRLLRGSTRFPEVQAYEAELG